MLFTIPSFKLVVYAHDEAWWRQSWNAIFSWAHEEYFFPSIVVRTLVQRKLRMRQQNTKATVLLDVAPERRTKRCSPRFRPGGRFCELSFRYLSPGREGEKCRPLDHMWQIPFIHSTRFITSDNFYIYNWAFFLLSPCGTFKCALVWYTSDSYTCALVKTLI